MQAWALPVLRVAGEHDLQIWKTLGRCLLLGAAHMGIGRPADGLARIRDDLDLYRGLKPPPVFWPLLLYIQAGAYARSGRPAEGFGLIADAIDTAGSEPTVPELYLLQGDLLLAVESGSAAESWSSGRSTWRKVLMPRYGRINPNSGKHDRVAAADGPALDNRGVNADVHCVVLSSRPQNS